MEADFTGSFIVPTFEEAAAMAPPGIASASKYYPFC